MSDDVYLKYWVHKVEELWKEVESLKNRVAELEAPIANRMGISNAVPNISPPTPQQAPPTNVFPASRPNSQPLGTSTSTNSVTVPIAKPVANTRTGQENPVITLLRHHQKMNIIDMNSSLKELGINESVRDTLFKRMKPFMDSGVVKFDKETQTFFLG